MFSKARNCLGRVVRGRIDVVPVAVNGFDHLALRHSRFVDTGADDPDQQLHRVFGERTPTAAHQRERQTDEAHLRSLVRNQSKILYCIAQWLAYLLPDPAATCLNPSIPEIFSEEICFDVAEVKSSTG